MSFKSWSYLPTRKWWMRPFSFINKTQETDIREQYTLYGVRGFDLFVRFNKNKQLVLCNGKIEYNYELDNLFNDLSWIDSRTGCYVRITLEDDKNKEQFKEFCSLLEKTFTHIKFFGGLSYDGETFYFDNFPKYVESNFIRKSSAKVHNSFVKTAYKDKDIVILSFVNYE